MADPDSGDPSFAIHIGFPAALIARPLLEKRGIISRDAAA
jgi:hypothetical protein